MPKVDVVQSRDATRELLDAIRSLLLEAFDDFTDDDWDHTLGGYHVVVTDPEIMAHAAVVPRLLHIGDRRFVPATSRVSRQSRRDSTRGSAPWP